MTYRCAAIFGGLRLSNAEIGVRARFVIGQRGVLGFRLANILERGSEPHFSRLWINVAVRARLRSELRNCKTEAALRGRVARKEHSTKCEARRALLLRYLNTDVLDDAVSRQDPEINLTLLRECFLQ